MEAGKEWLEETGNRSGEGKYLQGKGRYLA